MLESTTGFCYAFCLYYYPEIIKRSNVGVASGLVSGARPIFRSNCVSVKLFQCAGRFQSSYPIASLSLFCGRNLFQYIPIMCHTRTEWPFSVEFKVDRGCLGMFASGSSRFSARQHSLSDRCVFVCLERQFTPKSTNRLHNFEPLAALHALCVCVRASSNRLEMGQSKHCARHVSCVCVMSVFNAYSITFDFKYIVGLAMQFFFYKSFDSTKNVSVFIVFVLSLLIHSYCMLLCDFLCVNVRILFLLLL